MADDSVVLLDDSGSDEEVLRPPFGQPLAGHKRSRTEYLKLLSEAKDDTYESKKPLHPGVGASLEEIRKYQEDLYLYQEEVAINRQCEHLQFSTLLQEQEERAKRAVQERDLEARGVISDFAPFQLCRFLYAAPLADFIVWSDAQARILANSDEISIALTRPSPASKWGFEFTAPPDATWLEVKFVGAVTYARVADSVHAKLTLHLPPSTYPVAELATANAFAVMSKASTGKAAKAASKPRDALVTTNSKLRVGDQIVGVDHLDLRDSSQVREGVAAPVSMAAELLQGHSTHALLRVRRPRGVMSHADMSAVRPAWSCGINTNILRQQVVRLLAQEKLAMKWPKHASQYLDKMQQRIEAGIATSLARDSSGGSHVASETCNTMTCVSTSINEHPIIRLLRAEVSMLQDGLSRLPSRPASGAVPDVLLDGYVPEIDPEADDSDVELVSAPVVQQESVLIT